MLTGDLNVGLVPWIVQYRIKDPYNYLFKVNDVRRLLNDMSEAVMRLVVGDRSINEVISKRGEIANEARELLQRELDLAEAGVHIVTVELKRTNVPVPVQPSFNEVNQATQEKEQTIYQANEEYNKAIPAARGPGRPDHPGGRRLCLEPGQPGGGRCGPLPSDLRRVPQGQGRDRPAPVPGKDAHRAREHGPDLHRRPGSKKRAASYSTS
jgi:hypothetical protein